MVSGQHDGVVLGGEASGVPWFPVIGALIQCVAVSALILVGVLLTGEDLAVGLVLLLGTVLVVLVLAGVAQSLHWRARLVPVTLEANQVGLTVRKGRMVAGHWLWADVDLIRVDGRIGWRDHLVYRSGLESFPRLVVGSGGSLTQSPNLLLWGHARASALENQLRTLHSGARA